MTTYNARNERIKRSYFTLLKEADQMAEATIDGVRKALLRFEESTGFADFATFDSGQAIAFKRSLTRTLALRSGKTLSSATIYSTLRAVQDFLRWLAREPGYKSKIGMSDLSQPLPQGGRHLRKAKRCGARRRGRQDLCRQPAMRNGRCRIHGGKSTKSVV